MFYPIQPKPFNRVSWIIKHTGWKPKFWYWQPGTYMDFKDRGEGINRHCRDVSKSNVERHFKAVFGYSSFVNPNGKGEAVIKSETNGVHDGRIVVLPYDLKENEICQKLIETGLTEYRIVIVEGKPVCVLVKRKNDIFSSAGCSFELKECEFDKKKISDFCKRIRMDYGELDVLVDDKPYIIDANHCPGGGTLPNFINQPKKALDFFIECHKPLFK